MSPLTARIILGVLLVALVVALQAVGALAPLLLLAAIVAGCGLVSTALVYLIYRALDKDPRDP